MFRNAFFAILSVKNTVKIKNARFQITAIDKKAFKNCKNLETVRSTIMQCDRIVVLDHGHIVEDGTYDDLLKENGFFADLVKRQRVDAS